MTGLALPSWPPAGKPWPLPPLREDLQLFPAAPQADGAPTWMIHDPVANRFFQIGWLEFELLSRWSLRDGRRVLDDVLDDTPLAADESTLAGLIEFLRHQGLLRAADPGSVEYLKRTAAKLTESKLKWLLHNYLFFRLPLLRPQAFLDATVGGVSRMFFGRGFATITLIAALVGITLAARQWDVFMATLADTFSLEGIVGYMTALAFAKALHELGHAYTAVRYGVRVAHMGVAFIVLWPMLYTDTGESWKLSDRHQRFRIAAAGMAAEFALAAWATLGWCLLDDGAMRNGLFFLATTSWVITLGINASPFMRFDGYFLASDALDMPNLHQRSFALARRWLRGRLFGKTFERSEPDPEPTLSPGLKRGLIAFAIGTWLYRLVIFLGIAYAVYAFFFKLLGIFLFIVEIVWFIARPIWMEVKVWQERRAEIPKSRWIGLFVVLALLVAFAAFPWQAHVTAPAWAHADRQQSIYTPLPAKLDSIRAAGPIKAGELIAVLDSPDARSRAAQSSMLVQALELQLNQAVGRIDGLEKQAVFAEQLAQQQAEVAAATAELKRLELRAAFDGLLKDVDPHLARGSWVNGQTPMAHLIDPGSWVVEALVEQRQVGRLVVGAQARFFARSSPLTELTGTVVAIDSARIGQLPHPMLAAAHGGPIATLSGGSNQGLVPRDGLYRVKIKLTERPQQLTVTLGRAQIDGTRRSLLGDAVTSMIAVLVRESGF